MTGAAWLQLVVLVAGIAVGTRVLGPYLAGVYGEGKAAGDRLFLKVERPVYRLCGIDPDREQRWSTYAYSLLAFSVVSVLVLYVLQRVQGSLPFNPTDVGAVPEALSFNTAVSFVTNTNWQNYAGETTMSYLTQMAGLAVQNFVSAAVGISVAVALIRGLVRRRSATIGNFWVDLVRGTVRILLPLAVVLALVLVSQGVIQNLRGPEVATTVEGATQSIPGGPFASQEAIKELGTNGGGSLNANSAHPFANPNGFTNLLQMAFILLIPFALTYAYGRMVKDQKQGWVVFAAMFLLWVGSVAVATGFEVGGNHAVDDLGVNVTQEVTGDQAGGNIEGKEVRFGPAASGLFAATTTGTSTGAVISAHDSFTPLGGSAPLVNMMLGEVSPGGVGAGLYGMLIFALLAVFIAGLMVGRTPEFLGKKIQAAEMKLVVLYILAVPLVVLGFTGGSVLLDRRSRRSCSAPGPARADRDHLRVHVGGQQQRLGLRRAHRQHRLVQHDARPLDAGRPVLPDRRRRSPSPGRWPASSRSRRRPAPSRPTRRCSPGCSSAWSLIVVGLTYFPVLALGPIVEHLEPLMTTTLHAASRGTGPVDDEAVTLAPGRSRSSAEAADRCRRQARPAD